MPKNKGKPFSKKEEDKMMARVLVVDDEDDIRNLIARSLEAESYSVDTVGSVEAALDLMESNPYDVLITDKNLPDADGAKEGGMNLLRYSRKAFPRTEVIMMTGYSSVETAIEAIKLGAFDYLTKPFSLEDLREKIDRIMNYRSFLNSENALETYRTLHNELLSLLENRDNLPEEELHKLLKLLGSRIDQVFGAQKEWERIIQLQSEALRNIEAYAEELKKVIPRKDQAYHLVRKIYGEASKRIQ